MYIFLSHNSKDKALVEPIATQLSRIYGKESIFYDSWSIKPGEDIIDKMNSGLDKCDIFFFFVSSNSLNSEMVRMEWQNALMLKAKREIRFIPVRMDNSTMPAILTQKLYIDLNKTGFDNGCRQIIDVINGTDTQQYQQEFENFDCLVISFSPNHHIAVISVKNYFEPDARFMFSVDNDVEKIQTKSQTDGILKGGQSNDFFYDNQHLKVIVSSPCRGLKVGFPFILEFSSEHLPEFNIVSVYYEQVMGFYKKLKFTHFKNY